MIHNTPLSPLPFFIYHSSTKSSKTDLLRRNLLNILLAVILSVSGLGIFQPVAPVSAATLTVTSSANDGAGSLRQTIAAAASGDTITFDASITSITLTSELVISKNLTITGHTGTGVTLSGGGTTRIFNVTSGKLNLNWINLQNGYMRGSDGGLNVAGTVGGLGGAVYVASGAVFTATNVNFTGNMARGGNGGNGVEFGGSGGGGSEGGAPGVAGSFGGGGGGGSGVPTGGNGGFGGGGGGTAYGDGTIGAPGGTGGGGYGGNGSTGHKYITTGLGYNGGGAGAGMGGALFIAEGAMVGLNTVAFTNNSAVGGVGGNGAGTFGAGGGGGGAGLGSAVFNNGDLCQAAVTFSGNTTAGGGAGTKVCTTYGGYCPTDATAGQGADTSTGIFNLSGGASCGAWFNKPADIIFTPVALTESQPVGTLAGTFATTDDDAGDTFTYTLVSGTGSTDNASFAVTPGTNQLVTAVSLDYETKSSFSIRVRTTDSHGGYYEEVFTITITPVNDPPVISLSDTSVNENASIGTFVGELTSIDSEGNSVTYSLPGGGGTGCEDNAFFAINTDYSPTIYLVTAAIFDREVKSSYSICVRGTDNGTPPASADKSFTITVNDWNEAPYDIIPVFVSPLNENMGADAAIATLSVGDDHYNDNYNVTYYLVSGDGSTDNSLFYMDEAALREHSSLDYEAKHDYSVRVRAMDAYGLTYEEVLTFSIGDVNDAPTGIHISSDTVAENQPSGTGVGTLSTTDQDTSSFTYALTTASGCDSTDNDSFDLSTAGDLTTKSSFNYEVKNTYQICVQSTEDGASPLSVTQGLTISVTDLNEAPTSLSFAPEGTGVLESQADLTAGVLSSTDPDAGDTLTYTLPADPSYPDNAYFTVDGSTLKTLQPLDYESRGPAYTYSIKVRATDSGGLSIDNTFTVTVLNSADAPTDITFTAELLNENMSAGTLAGTMATTDVDSTTFTYSLVSGDGSTDNSLFTIPAGTNTIVTAELLDYETKSTYSVRVRTTAVDDGLWFEEIIQITIQNVNEAPTDISISNDHVEENLASGSTVGSFSSTDVDSSTFTYALVTAAGCDSTDNDSFALDAAGNLQTAVTFNYEAKSSYNICVQSADDSAASFSKQFTIWVDDVNDAPTDIAFTPVTLSENAAGATAGTLSFTDPDAGDTVTFSLPVDPATDNNLFQISGSNIQTVSGLNYEDRPAHTYTVRVIGTDSSGATVEESFSIVVSNVNENPTDITFTPATLNENQAGASAGSLATTDVDAGDIFTYTLACSTPGADDASFAIASGANTITTLSGLDFETQSSYSVCVRSTDAGGLWFDKPITITLQDVNEAPTAIDFTPVILQENQLNALAGSLSFTDPDAGDTAAYSLVTGTGDNDNALFGISGSELRTASALNYETQNAYSVRIAVTDANGLSYSKAFTINITDANDAPTDITLTAAAVNEGDPAGTLAGTLVMVDEDSGDTPTFELVSGSGDADNSSFSISGAQILTGDVFNFETQSVFNVRVRATDSNGETVEKALTIHLSNVNETPIAENYIPNQSIVAGTPFSFSFAANTFSDPDGDALTYTATLDSGDPLPAWLNLNSATRNFSGTPLMVETFTVRVTADDGNGASVNTDFQISVSAVVGNHNPVLVNPIPNTRAEIGDAFSFIFAANTFADYDDDPLSYLAAQSDGSPLPAWLSFASASRTFSGTPTLTDFTLEIKVTALDGQGGQASTTFTLGVGEENIEPSVNILIPDQSASRGALWTYQVPENSFIDPEGDLITYGASLASGAALPSWLSFDAGTRTFTGIPPETGQVNYFYEIKVTATDGFAGHQASDVFVFGPWSSSDIVGNLPAGTEITILSSTAAGPVFNLPNLTRWNYTTDITLSYEGESVTDLSGNGIQLCFHISPADLQKVGGNLSRLVIGTSHDGGPWQILPTTIGSDKTSICAYANQFSLFDVFARPAPDSGSSILLPETGFAPGISSIRTEQPEAKKYSEMGDIWVEIPSQGVQVPVVGIPLVDGEWDVSWLWENVGWLEGTAFPGMSGNSVISGHVFDANGNPDVFSRLGNLRWGSQIIVHAFNEIYIYEVRSVNLWVAPDDMRVVGHEDRPWLTLITCRGYDEEDDTYRWRTVVRAVLVDTKMK